MQLTFFGTGGSYPTAERQTMCVALPAHRVVLDAGTGLYRAAALGPGPMTAILSHSHLDHIAGLTQLHDLFEQGIEPPLELWADSAVIETIRERLFHPAVFPCPPAISYRALPPIGTPFSVRGLKIVRFPLDHPGGASGFRVSDGTWSMAYCCDTTAITAELPPDMTGADLLIHDCYLPGETRDEARRHGHSSAADVAAVASAAKAAAVAIVHASPRIADVQALADEVAAGFSGNVFAPQDGDPFEIGGG